MSLADRVLLAIQFLERFEIRAELSDDDVKRLEVIWDEYVNRPAPSWLPEREDNHE